MPDIVFNTIGPPPQLLGYPLCWRDQVAALIGDLTWPAVLLFGSGFWHGCRGIPIRVLYSSPGSLKTLWGFLANCSTLPVTFYTPWDPPLHPSRGGKFSPVVRPPTPRVFIFSEPPSNKDIPLVLEAVSSYGDLHPYSLSEATHMARAHWPAHLPTISCESSLVVTCFEKLSRTKSPNWTMTTIHKMTHRLNVQRQTLWRFVDVSFHAH